MLSNIEKTRLIVSRRTEPSKKSHFGQFLTPMSVAKFMASLFIYKPVRSCRLIDPGAGIGSLSTAFIESCLSGKLKIDRINLSAFEVDTHIHKELNNSLSAYPNVSYEVIGGDFIEHAVNKIQSGKFEKFTHAILNPPYKKINSNSRHRQLLRQVGIETVNLYSAFVALTLSLMSDGGQLVAIIPRSFCNGPYYKPFRDFILEHSAIRHIHLFDSRKKAFKEDDVLQENIIILLERGGKQSDLIVTTSTDDSFSDLLSCSYPFNRIVLADDIDRFIHVPTSPGLNAMELSTAAIYSLKDIGVSVSTGPVVDFRLREHLHDMPLSGDVPLIYPCHLNGQTTNWPIKDAKKPNAIAYNSETTKWLYPNGFYCVVRRFSSKEEKRRITASVVNPTIFPDVKNLGFENHLNLFHECKAGLTESLARGLTAYLNTTAVDEYFRRFSGHTQVNATDLKQLKYPSRDFLMTLGEKAKGLSGDQQEIDKLYLEIEELWRP